MKLCGMGENTSAFSVRDLESQCRKKVGFASVSFVGKGEKVVIMFSSYFWRSTLFLSFGGELLLLLKETKAETVISLPWLLNFFVSAICAKALVFPNENVKVGLSVEM